MSQNSPCIIYTPKDRVCCAGRTGSPAKHTRDQELDSPTLPIPSPAPRIAQHLPWTEDTHYLSVFWKTRQKKPKSIPGIVGHVRWGLPHFLHSLCATHKVHEQRCSPCDTHKVHEQKCSPCDTHTRCVSKSAHHVTGWEQNCPCVTPVCLTRCHNQVHGDHLSPHSVSQVNKWWDFN